MKQLLLTVLILTSLLATAGIYRHDVPVELYKAYANQTQFDCVGEVIEKDNNGGGSCVLIGKRYVLSAAHVFISSENVVDSQFSIGNAAITTYKQVKNQVGAAENYSFRFNKRRYTGKKIIIMPAYMNEKTKGQCDLALIELEEDVDGVTPAILNQDFDELNAIVTGVGYGASGKANKPEEVDLYHEKIAGQNIIDSFGKDIWNNQPIEIVADFDYPFHPESSKTGGTEPLLLEYAVGGGDSGGPLFRQSKDGWQLVGICSGTVLILEEFIKTGYYGQKSEWTRVSVFYDWINENMKETKTVAK